MSLYRTFKGNKFIYPTEHIRATIILSCIIIAISLCNCSDDDTASGKKPIVPSQKGNTWIYQDTTTGLGVSIARDTVTINDSHTSNDTTWWKLSAPFNITIAALEFATTADTIFSVQQTDIRTETGEIFSKEYIHARPGTSFTYASLFAGDIICDKTVKKISQPVTTPAGTFYSCYEYTYRIGMVSYNEIICPGVGLIKLTATTGKDIMDGYNYSRTLMKYTLH